MTKPTVYGEAEFPEVHIHPEIVFDASNPADTDPVFLAAKQAEFVLTITLPAKTDPSQVAEEVQVLLLAMRDYEIELGGKGLRFEEEPAPAGSIAFRVAAIEWEGAPARLNLLVKALTAETVPVELASAVQSLRANEATIVLSH